MAKVTTGTGDSGYTGLLGDERVPKYDPRTEALGTVDEATSALGLARATCADERVRAAVLRVQQDLYLLMGELATPPSAAAAIEAAGIHMTPAHVAWLEALEAELQSEVIIPNKFIIPGDLLDGAALDFARAVIRRAERQAARLLHEGTITNVEILRYLNRLSDVVFILARALEARQGGSTQAAR